MKLDGKDSVLEHYLMDVDNRLGHSTFLTYDQRVGALVGLLHDLCQVTDIEQVTTLHLRQCVQHLLNNPVKNRNHALRSESGILAVSTVKAYIRAWKAFFSWCYQEELIESNPAARLKPPKEEKKIRPTFTQEAIEKMLASCDTSSPLGFRDYVILLLLLDTGIRRAEIVTLNMDDVYAREGYIKVYGKGRKEREVGIHPEMGKLLWKYVHKYRKAPEGVSSLFVGRQGALTVSGIHSIVKKIQSESGLDEIKISAHVFRHTFARMYIESGGEIFKLSREMGHSSTQVTNIYLQDYGSREARKEHNSHSPLSSIKISKSRKKRR